jgi:uncharacterized protein YggL (DUF469 family)
VQNASVQLHGQIEISLRLRKYAQMDEISNLGHGVNGHFPSATNLAEMSFEAIELLKAEIARLNAALKEREQAANDPLEIEGNKYAFTSVRFLMWLLLPVPIVMFANLL